MDFVVFFTVEFLIFVVGAMAFGYCLLSCTSIYDSRNYQFACYLCKEMVWAKSWDRHRSECARQNEWYIDALPESPQVRSEAPTLLNVIARRTGNDAGLCVTRNYVHDKLRCRCSVTAWKQRRRLSLISF